MTADGFTAYTFGDLIEAGVLQVGDGYRAKNEELGGNGPIFLRAGHVTDTHVDFSGVERFTPEAAPRVTSKMSRPGDVVVTTKGNSTGQVTYVSERYPEFVYSPHLSFWRSLDLNRLVPGFLRYWSRGQDFREQLAGLAGSTDMAPYLSLVDQRRLRIRLPPPQDQRAIAHILGSLDDKIDLNRRMNETLEALARAIFKSWFVNFDPVRAKTEGRTPVGMDAEMAALFPDRMQESEIGEIPAGWTASGLDGIADFLNGLALQKYPPVDGKSLPVIKIAQLRARDTQGADRASNVPAEYIVEDGDILFSWSGSLLVDVWCNGKGALNQHLFKVTSGRTPKWFFFHAVLEHLPRFQDIAADKATTMGHIQRRHLTEAKVAVAPQKVFATADRVFAPLLGRIIASRLEGRTLANLRDTLLPELLSGELRVVDAERFLHGGC